MPIGAYQHQTCANWRGVKGGIVNTELNPRAIFVPKQKDQSGMFATNGLWERHHLPCSLRSCSCMISRSCRKDGVGRGKLLSGKAVCTSCIAWTMQGQIHGSRLKDDMTNAVHVATVLGGLGQMRVCRAMMWGGSQLTLEVSV
jgi:hypothetical protein